MHDVYELMLGAVVQAGYRDGVDAGKEKTLQHGFDIGEVHTGSACSALQASVRCMQCMQCT